MKQLHFGRPAYSAEPFASVDMLVLPETAHAVQTKPSTDGPAEVKVTFSSAEDMAEALFSAKAKTHEHAGLESLYTHKERAHEALLEHRDEIRNMDSGLRDHQQHLNRLCEFESGAKSRLATVSAEVRALQKQVDKLNQDAASFDSGLQTHTRVLEDHTGTLKSHARLYDDVSKLSQSLGGASAAVESRVNNMQQSVKQIQAQVQALKPRTVALDQQTKVDIVAIAPRKRA